MVPNLLRLFLRDDGASDLIEYALLTAVFGIIGAATLAAFPGVMKAVYTSWTAATDAIWQPSDPQ